MENIVEKGEIAHLSNFTFFHSVFHKFFLQCVKMITYGGKG